jgi:hypothetical protein
LLRCESLGACEAAKSLLAGGLLIPLGLLDTTLLGLLAETPESSTDDVR